MLRRCAELGVTELGRHLADYLEEVDSCTRATETNVLGMRKILKKYSRLPADNQHTDMLKKLLNKVRIVTSAEGKEICFWFGLFVCLFVCLSVCLSVG